MKEEQIICGFAMVRSSSLKKAYANTFARDKGPGEMFPANSSDSGYHLNEQLCCGQAALPFVGN